MPLLALIAIAILLTAILGPTLWVRHAMKKHSGERDDFPGTGGELARHLLDLSDLHDVKVLEGADGQDHYSPLEKVVRLSPANFHGRSVTAVAIAAHEVSHALQDAEGSRLLKTRIWLASFLPTFEIMASAVLFLAPVILAFTHSPLLMLAQIAFAILLLASHVVVHLLTLPVEFDASFKRALPILRHGGYLHESDMPAATTVLRAAAFTYVAGALMTMLNIVRLLRVLR